MKRIELKDIFNEPNPRDFGFKNKGEYEKLQKENLEKLEKKGRYKIIIISIIVLVEIIYLCSNSGSDSYLLLFVFIDAIAFPFINMFIENMFAPERDDRVMDYMQECIVFDRIASISSYHATKAYYEILNLEKEYNKYLRPSLVENICMDALYIKIMNDNRYKHELILKAIDEMLIPNIINDNESINAEADITMVLAWLVGLNIISTDEANERDVFRIDLIEKVANQAYGIIIANNKILLKKGKNEIHSILSISRNQEKKNIKELLAKYIENSTNLRIKEIKYFNVYNTDSEGDILDEQEYKKMIKQRQLKQVKTAVVYKIKLKRDENKKTNEYIWSDIDDLKNKKLDIHTFEILCEENIIKQ